MSKLIARYSNLKTLATYSLMGSGLGGAINSLIMSISIIKSASGDIAISDLFYYLVTYPLGGFFAGLIFYSTPAFCVGIIVILFRMKFSLLMVPFLLIVSSVIVYFYTRFIFPQAVSSFQIEVVIIGVLSTTICTVICFEDKNKKVMYK